MAKKSMLKLTGRQRDESGHESVTENCMTAEYYEKGSSSYILYEDCQEDKGAAVKNIIKYQDSVLEMTKRGSIRCRMIFENGRTHRTDYVTPYGTLPLETCTRKAEFIRLNDRIEIRLEYVLTSDGQFLSDCTLELCLRFGEN